MAEISEEGYSFIYKDEETTIFSYTCTRSHAISFYYLFAYLRGVIMMHWSPPRFCCIWSIGCTFSSTSLLPQEVEYYSSHINFCTQTEQIIYSPVYSQLTIVSNYKLYLLFQYTARSYILLNLLFIILMFLWSDKS